MAARLYSTTIAALQPTSFLEPYAPQSHPWNQRRPLWHAAGSRPRASNTGRTHQAGVELQVRLRPDDPCSRLASPHKRETGFMRLHVPPAAWSEKSARADGGRNRRTVRRPGGAEPFPCRELQRLLDIPVRLRRGDPQTARQCAAWRRSVLRVRNREHSPAGADTALK